jgi:hypothetical protein
MSASKNKPKLPKPPKSEFAELALKALRKAQRTAAQENARYGLPLIVKRTL